MLQNAICPSFVSHLAKVNPDKDTFIPEVPESGLDPGVLPTEIRKLVDRRRAVKGMMKQQGLSHDQYVQVI